MSKENTPASAHSSDLEARIFLTMERRGLNMRRLAALADLPYKTVQNYLSGKHRVPADALGRLAVALDVSADWLLAGQPARFNRAALVDALEVVFDFRTFAAGSGNPINQDDAGALFEKYYSKFYQEYLDRIESTDNAQRPKPPRRGEGSST